MRRSWRWIVVAIGVAVLVAVPAVVGAMPVSVAAPAPAVLLQRVVQSTSVPYQGYVLTEANLGLPNVSDASDAIGLLNNTSRLRAWVDGTGPWRVDQLSTVGEKDTYADQGGVWIWDSGHHRTTRVDGQPGARLVRPSDLLPPELGRLLATAATPQEVRALSPKRVANVAAAGLRITPRTGATTIAAVNLWVDPKNGLPLEVAVYGKGTSRAVLRSRFLDVSQSRPSTSNVTFQPPSGPVQYNDWDDVDVAARIDQRSPILLPDALGALARRSPGPAAVSTYGTGFTVVAAVGVPGRVGYQFDQELARLPSVDTPVGKGRLVQTPLLNALVVPNGDALYAVIGAVPPSTLTSLAGSLPHLGVAPL
ncbi:MAG TPA: hypothetical protein VG476_13250 [Acidimicrobiales bacterium]|nr:hypothetical protein [Acidimicrobiales bacterium]